MPISCESCRESLHSHLADFIATKSGEAPARTLAEAQASVSEQESAALSSTQRSEIEAHLAQCADCARELALLRGVTAQLHALPMVPAPLDLRARIQAQIASEEQAAPQPVAAREQTNTKRNSAASWFGLWRDFWRRPTRVAWAGAALTGILLLLATQANLPLPTTQSDSGTAPDSSPPAAMAPAAPLPPQSSTRQSQRSDIPRRPAAPRSTAQQNTKQSANARAESTRAATQSQVQREIPTSQQRGPQASAQPQTKASTSPPSTRNQVPPKAGAREPQSRTAVATPYTAGSAARPRAGTDKIAASKSMPAATLKTPLPTGNALSARAGELFARLQLESRTEQQAVFQGPAAMAAPESSATAVAPAPARGNIAATDLSAESQEQNRALGGAIAPGATQSLPSAQSPPGMGAFSMRRRNANSADAASEDASSVDAAAAGVASARPEETQRAAPDTTQKATSAVERPQRAASGETNTTSIRGAGDLANAGTGAAGTMQTPSALRRSNLRGARRTSDTVTARLVVTPPRDLSRARLRVVGVGGVSLPQVPSQVVWSGATQRGKEISVTLRLQIILPGTLRVVLEEAQGNEWKPVREQNLSVSSR